MSRIGARARFFAVVCAALLVLGACGGSDEDQEGSQGTGDSAATGECGGSGGKSLKVEAADFQYEPSELSAPAGEQVTVEFTNSDDAPHTFTIEDLDCDTGSVDAGQSAELSFTMPDADMGWICTIHPDMTGTLTPK